MANLQDWQPAAPAGQQLVAAAPLTGEWGRAPIQRSVGLTIATLGLPIYSNARWLGLSFYVVSVAALALWAHRWRRRHPAPTGLAGIFAADRTDGPVLLVTDAEVLVAKTRVTYRLAGELTALGPASTLPGLIALEADRTRLLLGFADGTTARMQLRQPTRGAAERVAALAAPVVVRHAAGQSQLAPTP